MRLFCADGAIKTRAMPQLALALSDPPPAPNAPPFTPSWLSLPPLLLPLAYCFSPPPLFISPCHFTPDTPAAAHADLRDIILRFAAFR